MASRREAVIEAVLAALGVASVTTVGGTTVRPAGLSVHRMRTRPLTEDDLPAQAVYLGEDSPSYQATGQVDRVLKVWVESRVEHSGTDPDSTLDPLLVWAVKALMAAPALNGGVAAKIDEGPTTWNLEERTEELAAAATQFLVTYQTAYNDPEILG